MIPKTELTVSGQDLIQAMSVIKTTMRGTYRMAVGIFSNQNCLKICTGPLTTSVTGNGSFDGMAIFRLILLLDFADTLTPDDVIRIRKLPSSIAVGPLEFACEWKDIEYDIPDWPYKTTLAQIIGLEQRYDREVLDYQMLSNTIRKAKARLNISLLKAAEFLRETGIEYDDLDMLMDDVIKRAAEEDRENVIW